MRNPISRKSTKVEAAKVEAQVEAPAQVEAATTPAVEAPAVEAPVEAKAKGKRYAPVSSLAQPNAVLTWVQQPNPHRDPNSKTFKKHALFEVGMSVAQVEAKFVENGHPKGKARNQLRWAIEHNQVTLGVLVEAPQS